MREDRKNDFLRCEKKPQPVFPWRERHPSQGPFSLTVQVEAGAVKAWSHMTKHNRLNLHVAAAQRIPKCGSRHSWHHRSAHFQSHQLLGGADHLALVIRIGAECKRKFIIYSFRLALQNLTSRQLPMANNPGVGAPTCKIIPMICRVFKSLLLQSSVFSCPDSSALRIFETDGQPPLPNL